MDVDMDQIWKTIFSKEAVGIMVLIIVGLLVFNFIQKMSKIVLSVIALAALVIVGYIFFPGFLESAVSWLQGGWMN